MSNLVHKTLFLKMIVSPNFYKPYKRDLSHLSFVNYCNYCKYTAWDLFCFPFLTLSRLLSPFYMRRKKKLRSCSAFTLKIKGVFFFLTKSNMGKLFFFIYRIFFFLGFLSLLFYRDFDSCEMAGKIINLSITLLLWTIFFIMIMSWGMDKV